MKDNNEDNHIIWSNKEGHITQTTDKLTLEGGHVKKRVNVGPGQVVTGELIGSTVSNKGFLKSILYDLLTDTRQSSPFWPVEFSRVYFLLRETKIWSF